MVVTTRRSVSTSRKENSADGSLPADSTMRRTKVQVPKTTKRKKAANPKAAKANDRTASCLMTARTTKGEAVSSLSRRKNTNTVAGSNVPRQRKKAVSFVDKPEIREYERCPEAEGVESSDDEMPQNERIEFPEPDDEEWGADNENKKAEDHAEDATDGDDVVGETSVDDGADEENADSDDFTFLTANKEARNARAKKLRKKARTKPRRKITERLTSFTQLDDRASQQVEKNLLNSIFRYETLKPTEIAEELTTRVPVNEWGEKYVFGVHVTNANRNVLNGPTPFEGSKLEKFEVSILSQGNTPLKKNARYIVAALLGTYPGEFPEEVLEAFKESGMDKLEEEYEGRVFTDGKEAHDVIFASREARQKHGPDTGGIQPFSKGIDQELDQRETSNGTALPTTAQTGRARRQVIFCTPTKFA
mmetsp:Transcript_20901/g.31841  ORF Transcript_20901/g.31841 Transcript_20901/m.31841 type:complete len:420 (+) Transcript_20901:153-1412(+)